MVQDSLVIRRAHPSPGRRRSAAHPSLSHCSESSTPMRKPFCAVILAALVTASPLAAHDAVAPGWVSAWATALDLAPPPKIDVPPPPKAVIDAMRDQPKRVVPFPTSFENQTIRMVLQPTVGASRMRFQFSNAIGKPPLALSGAAVAIRGAGSAIAPGTHRPLTFGGKAQTIIPPGAIIVSDPVDLPVRPDQELAVSLYLRGKVEGATTHALGLNPAYVAPGDQSAAATLTGASEVRSYFWLTGMEVVTDRPTATIVAFGDSITDGFATSPGAHRTWPEVLARRLRERATPTGWSVINMGISGNRVLRDGAGMSGIARFDRDVLSRNGVKWMIVLEGINDINMTQMAGLPEDQRASAQDIIGGLRAIVEKAHLHGIKVMGATITPTEGLWLYNADAEATRQTVNEWIRSSGTFDAVADFDRAIRDPQRPTRMLPVYDSGDHVHPSDAGTKAMADTIDLVPFTQAAPSAVP